MAKMNKPAVSGTDWLAVILGILGSIAVLLGVWFGLKAAMGPGGDFLKTIGDMLGKSIAGGYGALKKARSGTAGVLGIGPAGPLPARRTTLRSPTQVADTTAPAGTPAAMSNISPVNLPEPSGDFTMTNPGYSSKQDFINRRKTQRNPTLKIKTPTQIAQTPATPGTPAQIANIPAPDADELLRRQRAERNRVAQPAGTGLFDLGNRPGPIDDIAQRKPKGPGRVTIAGPGESNVQKIARLAREKKAVAPPPVPRRRKIAMEESDEEDTPSLARTASIANRLKRASTRAKESVADFDKAVENTPTSNPADPTKIFGSRAMRQRYGIEGGKRKRKNRLKTGRKV
jgi:hypothetical protein